MTFWAWLLGLDERLLLGLNAWVARTPEGFYRALTASDRWPWLLAAAALVALWFSGEQGVVPIYARWTRLEARRRVLLTFGALVTGFLLARVLQGLWVRPRPLQVVPLQAPILPSDWNKIRTAFNGQGAFPSDHAVMFFVLVTLLTRLSKRLGGLALGIALYFSALRVGLGFHWPLDMVGGAGLGVLATGLVFVLEPWLAWPVDRGLLWLHRRPLWLHLAFFLLIFDFSQKFSALFGLLTLGLGHAVGH